MPPMPNNQFKIAIRNFIKHRSFSTINILGLAIGMAASLLIFLWVEDELSYDNFHAENIYRLTTTVDNTDLALTSFPLAKNLQTAIPGVKNTTRLMPESTIFSVGNKKFEETRVFYADSTFLQVFSFPLLSGDRRSALDKPDGVLVTEDLAKKYFGTIDAMGKTLQVANDITQNSLVVTGVLKNLPGNSHLQFDVILPMSLYQKNIDFSSTWDNFSYYTYIRMDDHFIHSTANLKSLEKKIDKIYATAETKTPASFYLQPLRAIHLHSKYLSDVEGQGNMEYVRIFSATAIFILLLACINFINLSTALSGYRAKEVGVCKVLGASRSRLIVQFLGESVLLSITAMMLALIISWSVLPLFNQFSHKTLALASFDHQFVWVLGAITVFPGLIAGIYPALVLSGFKPLKVLKGIKSQESSGPWFRNSLVVFQFAISIVLIISAVTINSQLHYIFNRNVGFNKENLVYIKMPQSGDLFSNTQALQSTLRSLPQITDYTVVSDLPANLTRERSDVSWTGKDPKQQVIIPNMLVDEHFAKTFKIGMVEGRFFSSGFGGDDSNYIVNETALKMMDIPRSSAIGKQLTLGKRHGQIIGVISDFNFKPVHQAIEPLILRENQYGGYLVVRVQPYELQNTIGLLEQVFQKVYPVYPFSYSFLDEALARSYRTEQQVGDLLNIFSFLSIFVSCIGLFGLATFTAQNRTKEIGIRRVIGASAWSITKMLSKDFLKPVILGMFISFPVSWWLMTKWLENFAYHINISVWIFATAGLAALMIALATVSFQSIKAAFANPVKSLRTE